MHEMMRLVMWSGKTFESNRVLDSIKCSHSGELGGMMYEQSCIGQHRSLKSERQSNFRMAIDAFVPS